MIELISRPWPWYVAGPLIGLLVPFVYWFGRRKWGISSTLRHGCAALLPRRIEYFDYDWRANGSWQLAMALGIVVGGFVAARFLSDPGFTVAIAEAARSDLAAMGLGDFRGLAPSEIFSWASLATPTGSVVVVGGGFLVGFGARYAGGCTSGHAISGVSALYRSSLTATVGFFIGGLIASWLVLPALLR